MAKDWMKKLQGMEGAVLGNYDRFAHVIETPSPSINFAFGKGGGLPLGYSVVLYGPPKGGKTLVSNAIIGNLHRTDPEAIVVKFDTEMREEGQLRAEEAAIWGIDPSRYICFSTNIPNQIFDRISNELAAMCQEGMPLKLIIIDSLSGIMGRRALNADTIDTMQIGDEALTIQTGLKQILPTQRKHNIGLIMTAHVRAEMDQLEQKRGNKVRMAASFGVQHHAEYFMYVERNRNKEARADILGNEFKDENAGDLAGNADVTAHKIRAIMKANSMGPAGRVAEFTLDYRKGIINTHEEVFLLGTNRGVIERPNQLTYAFGGQQWKGKEAMVNAIRDYPDLYKNILKELRKRDAEGKLVEPVESLEEEAPKKEAK
jgi:RecA/RadA recombinase